MVGTRTKKPRASLVSWLILTIYLARYVVKGRCGGRGLFVNTNYGRACVCIVCVQYGVWLCTSIPYYCDVYIHIILYNRYGSCLAIM